MAWHGREHTLLALLLLLSLTAGLFVLHGTALLVFGAVTALLWIRFIVVRVVQARQRWSRELEELEQEDVEAEASGPRPTSRTWLAVLGVQWTALTIGLFVGVGVFVARIARDGATGSHVLALTVLLFAAVGLGRLVIIWWQTFFANPTNAHEALRSRLVETSLLNRFDRWTNE
jgi:hypothetical protein